MTGFDDLPILAELRDALVDTFAAPEHRRRRFLWRSRPLAIVVGIGLAGGAAGAMAAAGVFRTGAPVRPPGPVPSQADIGVVPRSSMRLLDLRVPDPDGGPPWGLRLVRTNRGAECVQVGRVAFGMVGEIGRDGAFHDDGRYHPLSPNAELLGLNCGEPDAHGNAFLNVTIDRMPASGLDTTCGIPHVAPCRTHDLRDMYFGLLGPQARSVTYQIGPGAPVARERLGEGGAYLIVTRHVARQCEPGSRLACQHSSGTSWSGGAPAISGVPFLRIDYSGHRPCIMPPPRAGRFGSRAIVRGRPSRQPSCLWVGYVQPSRPRITAREVASPIRVKVIAARHYCHRMTDRGGQVVPCSGGVPHGYSRMAVVGDRQILVEISFRTRIPLASSRSHYEVDSSGPGETNMDNCSDVGGVFGPIDWNLRKGEVAHFWLFTRAGCRGVHHGSISYVTTDGPADTMPGEGEPGQTPGVLVGRFSFRTP